MGVAGLRIDWIDGIDVIDDNAASETHGMKSTVIKGGEDPIRALEGVVNAAVRHLSARHIASLVQHPEAVGAALAAVAATLATEGGSAPTAEVETITGEAPHLIGAEEGARRLDAITQPGPSEEVLSSDELAARMGFKTRQSVHNRLSEGRIVGWQTARRGYVFPAGQLDERGRPPAGLERVVPHFADGYSAWMWLKSPHPALDGATPLNVLKRGHAESIAAAAQGEMQADFM